MYRFEKGDTTTGYVYDLGASGSAKWANEATRTITGAIGDLSIQLTAYALTFIAYFTF